METKALFNTETTQWPTFQQAQISLISILKIFQYLLISKIMTSSDKEYPFT